jgi:hypothetical protein
MSRRDRNQQAFDGAVANGTQEDLRVSRQQGFWFIPLCDDNIDLDCDHRSEFVDEWDEQELFHGFDHTVSSITFLAEVS